MTILDDARAGMDAQIRPQDDLFGHVNGAWLEEATIPDDRASWGPFVMLADEAEQQVHAIIEQLAAQTSFAGPHADDERKISDLYTSFMDEETIEALGVTPVLPRLAAIDQLTDPSQLAAYLGEYERRGGGGLFGMYVNNDDKDADRYIVNITQGGLGLPDESYYREDKFAQIRAAYVIYLKTLLELADQPDAETQAQAAFELEKTLAQGHWERAETRDVQKTYNLRTFAQFQELLPTFDLATYMAQLGGDEATIAEVNLRQPSYLEHLATVLESTDMATWRAYLRVKALRGAASYLSAEFVEANFDFYGRTLAGTPQLRARWKRGVSLVEGALGEAVGREYVARHFPPESKTMMDELVANLLQAYRESIQALDWMSPETKTRALEKLEQFVPKIGYPNKWRDYSALQISRDDLFGNIAAISEYVTDRELGKIGQPVDRDEWFMLPQTVNAYYNPGTNEICFPAGILQRPFFAPDADPAENYGGIGAVIGHEIGHGFDDQGSQFDGHGNMKNWWTEADRQAFQARAQMLIEQYNEFEPRNLPGERVNGELTVGENIGDLGGLTIALKAYLLSLGDQPVPERDGWTGIQRLFLNWAHVWRTKRRKELDLQYLTTDPHSPPEFRANIARNLDEFHAAFATQPGDGLWVEPDKRVRIW